MSFPAADLPQALPLSDFVARIEPGRKGEILGAAADVFVVRGYEAGSMRDIASRVGVSEPALYRHFPGKEALFLELIRVVALQMRAEGFRLIEGVGPEDLADQIAIIFADRRRAFACYAPLLRTIAAASAHNPRFLTEYRRMIIDPMRERLSLKARELDEAFGVGDADATRDARVRALMALFIGYFVSTLVLADEPDRAVADAVLRVMQWDS
jgi:AcrR family transcriptional regulator